MRLNRTVQDVKNEAVLYADYQATTPIDPRVLAEMEPYWRESFGNPHSSDHAVGWRAAAAVEQAQAAVASLIGADPDEIIFTSGATEANNLALFGPARRALAGRRRILVSAIEHKCVLSAARALEEREEFIVETIPVDREGFVDLAALSETLDDDVLLASVMAVNNEVGVIQDLPRIASMLARYGVIFHCDAAQAPCAMDVSELAHHADLISLSAHKMYGPPGIGALYIRRDLQQQVEPIVYGGGQQNGLRSGTVPLPICVGMAAAAELAGSVEAAAERKRIGEQRNTFVAALLNSGFSVKLNGPTGERRHPANANLRFNGLVAQDVLAMLQPGVAAATGAACSSGLPEPSHVLRAMGLSVAEAEASVRFSFGRFTTDDETGVIADRLMATLEFLKTVGVEDGGPTMHLR